MRRRFPLARSLVVRNIDELVIKPEPWVRLLEFLGRVDHRQVSQLVIPPPEELCNAWSRPSLLVERDYRNA